MDTDISIHKATLSKLPFRPVEGQVIYIDPNNDKRINTFIARNYKWLKKMFRKSRLEFCYLPLLGKELASYHAPYLNDSQRNNLLLNVPSLLPHINRADGESLTPSLLYALNEESSDLTEGLEMRLVTINAEWFQSLKKVFRTLSYVIKNDLDSYYITKLDETIVHESSPASTYHSSIRFSVSSDHDADIDFDFESKKLIREIRERIDALRNKGVNTMFLHEIVDEGEPVSSLHITKDFRIILPEYDNMEIKLPNLLSANNHISFRTTCC